ncbi:MAG: DNA primase [Actinomycetaceae bacterium]|nr:DNA primase [Actinomycetaceae bacterium]
MAGLIKREDIAAVREAVRIEDIVSEHVTLTPAGIGSVKGLCPFHDEKTPSFNVRPALGLWHCFGCGQGGDVIDFVREINHVSFTEAVEFLAGKIGFTLHYEEGKTENRSADVSMRSRIIDQNRIAAEFFRQHLASPAAGLARQFLAERGFGPEVAARFGIGFSPDSWDELLRYLRGRGFTEPEILASGLMSQGSRGPYDRFRGRLMWPIRDLTGTVVGFGARRLREDDNGPKYLNTPETAVYKKSQVLFGIDLAKNHIAKTRRLVIVEGYTDVMAAHLAGVLQAVATCGTAFGPDHVRIARRLIGDSADPAAGVMLADGTTRGGEVIFTFDGDAAGQKAALRAFKEDQHFASQTFVAVEKTGMDPCELRMNRGDQALVDLIRSREPLFAFAIRSMLGGLDLSTAEGRVKGLHSAAPIVAQIRDRALRREYVRELAGWLGMETGEVAWEVKRSGGGRPRHYQPSQDPQEVEAQPSITSPADPVTRLEQQCLEVVLQRPGDAIGAGFDNLPEDAFLAPMNRAVHDAIRAGGGLQAYANLVAKFPPTDEAAKARAAQQWLGQIIEQAGEFAGPFVRQLAVVPLKQDRPDKVRDYVQGVVRALVGMSLTRSIGQLRAKLGGLAATDPQYGKVFEQLMDMENARRILREGAY